MEQFNKRFKKGCFKTKIFETIRVALTTTIHTTSLVLEMIIVHTALTSSFDSCFVFVFLDCFKELNLCVFKKADYTLIFQMLCDDSTERFQFFIYVTATFI